MSSDSLVLSEQQDWLEQLVPKHLRLEHVQRASVDMDQAGASFAVGDGGGCLLAAENLHRNIGIFDTNAERDEITTGTEDESRLT